MRTTPGETELSVAPNWLWILGVLLLGVVAGARYAAPQRSLTERRQ